MYALTDTETINGHVLTKDKKFILVDDDDCYCYWHGIKSIDGDIVKTSYMLGRYAYDYCFHNSLESNIDKLNALLN